MTELTDQKVAIEKLLGGFWDRMAIEMGAAAQTTTDLEAPLDSLTSMEALLEIDELLGRKIPVDAVIQKGGYQSREDFVGQVSERVQRYVSENPE